jgi:hypothetical protein
MCAYGLAELYLVRAMRSNGCPICRCNREAERRYLRFLLWERVTDAGTRMRLVHSLGFCHLHANLFLQLELDDWDRSLGNTVIYESLALQACERIREAQRLIDRRDERPLWKRLTRRLIRRGEPREAPQLARGACPVCENVRQSEEHYCSTLVDMLAYPKYQAKFEQSSGVCLAHLQIAIDSRASSDGLCYLLNHTENRLRALAEASRDYQENIQDPDVIAGLGNEAAKRAISLFAGDEGGVCCDPRWRRHGAQRK